MPGALTPLAVIARGAQGSVYLVHEAGLSRFFALKVVEAAGAEAAGRMAGQLRRFATGEPDPPVAILDLWIEAEAPAELRAALPAAGGTRLLVLQPLVLGPNLRELCEGDEGFGLAEAACALAQTARRLARLPAGLAHGDVKPENVLVDASGRAFLVDPLSGAATGSPPYAAPERKAGGEPRPAADVYGLAVMGHGLLARRFPKADDPEGFLPPLREPADTAPPPVRRAFADLTSRLVAGRHAEEGKRGTREETAAALSGVAGELSLADLAAPLAAAYARARMPERIEVLRAEIAKVRPGAKAPASPPAEGRASPRRRVRIAAGAAGAVVLAATLTWAFPARRREAAAAAPAGAPAPVVARKAPPDMPPAVFTSERLSGKAPALPLDLGATIPDGYGGFQIDVVNPERWIAVSRYSGDVVWKQEKPALGVSLKIALLPDDYQYQQLTALRVPRANDQSWPLTIRDGQLRRFKTQRYVLFAPSPPGTKAPPPDPKDPLSPTGPLLPDEQQAMDEYNHPK